MRAVAHLTIMSHKEALVSRQGVPARAKVSCQDENFSPKLQGGKTPISVNFDHRQSKVAQSYQYFNARAMVFGHISPQCPSRGAWSHQSSVLSHISPHARALVLGHVSPIVSELYLLVTSIYDARAMLLGHISLWCLSHASWSH